MKVAIRYYSRGGNIKKLAHALEEVLDVKALTTNYKLKEDVDVLFLGSSVYAYGVDEHIKDFINDIDVHVGKVVNFSTAALVKSTYHQIEKLLNLKNIPLAKEEFYCKGSFGLLHKGKPDENDIKNIQKFARDIIKM